MKLLDRYMVRPHDFYARWLASPVLMCWLLGHTLIGSLFWIQASLQTDAFNVQTFGEFALRFPAEWWAAAMMGGSLLTFAGMMHPPHRWAMIAGSIINVLQFSGLSYSAAVTGGEVVVGMYAGIMFAVGSFVTLLAALHHDTA